MNNLTKKKTVIKVKNFLYNISPKYEIIQLKKTATTAKDAANSLNVEVGSIVKSLIFKSKINNNFFLCLMSGDKNLSIEKLSILTNTLIIKAHADEVKNITGYSIGGVPPIAHKNIFPTFIDINLSRFKYNYAEAGHPHCVFKISYKELCEITKGKKEILS